MIEDIERLRSGIRDLLGSHPEIGTFYAGHTSHLERYECSNGEAIGHEADRTTKQNIWVRQSGIRLHKLTGIDYRLNTIEDRKAGSSPNHHLFAIPAFKDADLVCFFPADLWEAARIIREVTGSD